MRIEILVMRLESLREGEVCSLEFDDGMPGQYCVTLIKRDSEGKVIERKVIGNVNKRDIIRVAKAS